MATDNWGLVAHPVQQVDPVIAVGRRSGRATPRTALANELHGQQEDVPVKGFTPHHPAGRLDMFRFLPEDFLAYLDALPDVNAGETGVTLVDHQRLN